eukprot:GEZU01038787.1.p1 GENE.GEZU01038787.1~~GEZU01038787.1.p1  ORF type:complete len:373 (-),score=133.48 GEZU01038787.1:249-1367(-)
MMKSKSKYNNASSDTRERIRAIRKTIRTEEDNLRKKYTWLRHQNILGLSWFLVSLFAMVIVSYLYLRRMLHWGLSIPLIAIALSIFHELEHDLIHNLYFKGRKWVQDLMFLTIWISKGHLNPWYRRWIHLRHHNNSGSRQDIEERLIGIGQPVGYKRIIATFHPLGSTFFFADIKKDNPDFNSTYTTLMSLPVMGVFIAFIHLFHEYLRLQYGITFGAYDWVNLLPAWGWPIVRDVAVLWVLPNTLRQACLNLMATYSHYFDDVPVRNVYYQNQILNHWALLPFNLFCFNFGSTHIIHHYVTDQPFYLRQMLASAAHAEIIKQGARHNDIGIVLRNNRFGDGKTKIVDVAEDENENESNIPPAQPAAPFMGS